jgi:hypothetical protein
MPPKLTLYAWVLVPVALLAFHFGPGQAYLHRDAAARHLAEAGVAEKQENWPVALKAYADALREIPATDGKRQREVRLAHARARMYSGEIVEAMSEMKALLAELPADGSESLLGDEVRETLGTAEYYTAWLMRLEGAAPEEWTAEVDNARQQFRYLAENQIGAGLASAKEEQEHLEAAIRLERTDLSELRGLPLPKFCENCKNVCEKCRSLYEKQHKKPAEKPADNRKAGTGERSRGGS